MPGKFFRSAMLTDRGEQQKIDSSVAHIARVYDYWLGGKDNFAIDSLNKAMTQQFTMRTHAEVERFFDGLTLIEPGVVLTHEWRPDAEEGEATPGVLWAGVARKP